MLVLIFEPSAYNDTFAFVQDNDEFLWENTVNGICYKQVDRIEKYEMYTLLQLQCNLELTFE